MSLTANISSILFEIQTTGKYKGKNAKVFHINGRRVSFTSTSVFNDIGEGVGASSQALFPVLTGAEIIQVISSSASDDGSPAGIGAQTVKVTYIDTNFNLVTTGNIILNGTTAVQVVASGMLYPLFWEVTAVGSNGVSVGNLTLRTSAPLTLSRITAGGNASLDCRFIVPEGYKGYIFSWSGGNIQGSQDLRLRATVNKHDRSLLSGIFHFQANNFTGTNLSFTENLPLIAYPGRAEIKISTISASLGGNVRADAHFDILIIQD